MVKTLDNLLIFIVLMATATPALATIRAVNCDLGGTITQTLQQAQPGDTIRVRGLCHETVAITTDRLTIEGRSNPIIDGGGATQDVVTMDGIQGVTITGLTVRNGFHGIVGKRGAAFALRAVRVQENADDGIMVDENATARLTDCTVLRNGDNGILVTQNSSVTFEGTIISNTNGDEGIILNENSSALFRQATVRTNNNGDAGLNITGSSSATFENSTFEANNNTTEGMRLLVASALRSIKTTISISRNGREGFSFTQNSAMDFFEGTFRSTQNTGHGILMVGGASIRIFGRTSPSTVVLSDNTRNGLELVESSLFVTLNRPNVTVTMTGNGGNGVRADNGAALTINDSTITGNTGSDITAFFGSRLTLQDNIIGSISCDSTVLSRGTTRCP